MLPRNLVIATKKKMLETLKTESYFLRGKYNHRKLQNDERIRLNLLS